MDVNDEDINILRSQPTADQVSVILQKTPQDGSQEFEYVSTLVDYVVPVSDDLAVPVQQQLLEVLTSLTGIEALLTRITLAAASDAAKVQQLVMVLDGIVGRQGILAKLVTDNRTVARRRFIRSLFFGSKLLSQYMKAAVDHNAVSKYGSAAAYIDKMVSEYVVLVQTDIQDDEYMCLLLVALLRLDSHYSLAVWQYLLDSQCVAAFLRMYHSGRANKKLIDVSIVRFLDLALKRAQSVDSVVPSLRAMELDADACIAAVSHLNSRLLQVVVGVVGPHTQAQVLQQALRIWGEQRYISSTSLAAQESMTNLLIFTIKAVGQDTLVAASQDPAFLDSITSRISSTTTKVRSLGMLVGNLIFTAMGKDPIFKIDSELEFQQRYVLALEGQLQSVASDDVASITSKFETAVVLSSDDDLDDDAEDSDDDPTVADRTRPSRPLFLKELVSYISTSSKDTQAAEKRRLALAHGPKLILRSSLKNLRFYDESLISSYIGLNNEFEEADFDDLRLKCLISCCVADPHDASAIILRLFVAGDYSLQQRLTLLTTLSLSCRYLRGFEDSVFKVDESKVQFRSTLLPPDAHRQFMAIQQDSTVRQNVIASALDASAVDAAMSKNSSRFLREASNVRVSAKLSAGPKPASGAISKTKIPDFYKIVGPKFLFPLTGVWCMINEEGAWGQGAFASILVAHFLKSIGLVFHTVFPSAADLEGIVKEVLNVVNTAMGSVVRLADAGGDNGQMLVLDSIAFTMLVLLENCSDQFLANFFLTDLLTFNNAMVTLMNENSEVLGADEVILQKCVAVTIRLRELFERFEAHLFVQGV